MWAIQDEKNSPFDAQQVVNALKSEGKRARVVRAKRQIIEVKPPVYNVTKSHRELQAAIMNEIADTNKRYKSPG